MKHLLASHGSPGSIAAEEAAIESCCKGDSLDHLYVIPSWWADMVGDDWLNNGVSRNSYRNYLENELYAEAKLVSDRIESKCQCKNIHYQLKMIIGDSEKTLMSLGQQYEKVFIGSRCPKKHEGLNDRMLTNQAKKTLQDQLEIIAYPHG